MRTTLKHAFITWALLLNLIPGCALAEAVNAQLLVFRVAEPGTEPYISRLLITQNHLRMDQGEGDPGFILLDRHARVIYSVSPEARQILVIDPQEQDRTRPEGLRFSARHVDQQAMPAVSGKRPEHWEFLVDDQLCRSAVVVPGLMAQALKAYGEYLDLLAYQQQTTLGAIPQELQNPCDAAIHIHAPLAVLERGLPLREWDWTGRRQELVDYRESFSVPAEAFQLPAGFRRQAMEGLLK